MWFILSFWRKSRIPCLYLCVCVSVQLHLWLVKSCNACNHTGSVSGSFDINLDMTLNAFKEWVYMDQTNHYKQCLVKRIAVIHICFSSLRFVLFFRHSSFKVLPQHFNWVNQHLDSFLFQPLRYRFAGVLGVIVLLHTYSISALKP